MPGIWNVILLLVRLGCCFCVVMSRSLSGVRDADVLYAASVTRVSQYQLQLVGLCVTGPLIHAKFPSDDVGRPT